MSKTSSCKQIAGQLLTPSGGTRVARSAAPDPPCKRCGL